MAVATEVPSSAVTLHWPLTEDQFADLCTLNPEMRLEYTSTGDLIIMTGTGGWTGHTNANLIIEFGLWARGDGTGLIFDSSTIFTLPNGARRSPDVAWVSRARWEMLSLDEQRGFPPLCPDFVLELRSRTDRLVALQNKMQEYQDNGARLGWLIDPIERIVHVYRPEEVVECFETPLEISGEPVLPGFALRLAAVWDS